MKRPAKKKQPARKSSRAAADRRALLADISRMADIVLRISRDQFELSKLVARRLNDIEDKLGEIEASQLALAQAVAPLIHDLRREHGEECEEHQIAKWRLQRMVEHARLMAIDCND